MKKISISSQFSPIRPALFGSAVVLALLIALWRMNPSGVEQRPAASASALRGQAAIARLKEQGSYGSLQAAMQAARYGASWAEQTPFRQAAFHAPNPAQRFDAYFTPQGARIFSGRAEVGLKPKQIGYGTRLLKIEAGKVQANNNRIEIKHPLAAEGSLPALEEWYVNQAAGLEQGFTLAAAPGERQQGEQLRLALELSGDWRAELQADGQALLLSEEKSGRRLSYAGLKAWDASQRPLPATMKLAGRELVLEINDSEAAYPVTIDPTFTQFNKLTANDGAGGDAFGSSVAVDGDTAIIGAPGDDGFRGSAYVFVKSGANWSFQQKLTAGDGGAEDQFGISVDVSGNLAVVGQYNASEFAAHPFRGGAYIFVRSGATWTQQQLLTSGITADSYGVSVGISGTTATVGAPEDSTAALNRGAVYVYTQGPSPFFIWFQQQKLLPGGNDLATNDNFGRTVAINHGNNNLLMIGAPRHLANRGAVYYFSRSGSVWTQQQRLLAGDGIGGDFFGEALAFDATTVVVGAPKYNPGSAANQGAAYAFALSGMSYAQQGGTLLPTDALAGDQFGFSVGVSGDAAIFGAPGDDIGANSNQGSAYLYERAGASWTAKQKLIATDGAASNSFGAAVAISGNNAMAGAPGNAANRGAAYSFNGSSAFPKQTQLLAGDAANLDEFGGAVAISGDTVVVGAPRDDIGAATDRGSAYVFVRTHTPPAAPVWSQQQKLTASDGIANDLFGQAVAISGDVIIVARAGGAYVFERAGGAWTQSAILTPIPGSQLFGASVAVFGNTAIVGAPGDDTGGTDRGAAHVYVKAGASWQLQQKITAGDGADNDFFGSAVALGEDTALIGAKFDDNGAGLTDEGSAYVFTRSGAAWSQQAKLFPNDFGANRSFGTSVALSGNTAIIGTPNDNADTGAAYVYVRSGVSWPFQQKLQAGDRVAGDRFGSSVGISGNVAVVGVFADEVNGKVLQGSAYVFTRSGTTWSQTQRLVADLATGSVEDAFGFSVGASGDTVVVGAPFDDVTIANQGSVCVFDNWPTAKIDMTPTTLANGASGSGYSQTLTGSGGTAPYTFSLIGGVLPAGLTLSSAGVLSGTPSSGGVFNFMVLAVDANGCSGARTFSLFVCGTIMVNPVSLPGGVLSASYSQTLSGAGGAGSYSFTLTGGALPGGLALNAGTGVLSGTFSASGTFNFTVRATDSGGCFGERAYTLIVAACTTLTVNSLGDTPDASAGNGVCADAGGQCTLRAAIEESNALGCGATINFSVTGTINLGSALPNLDSNVTINGPGAALLTVRRNAGGNYRIFTINAGRTVTVNALTITNGTGGILNSGTLTISSCAISGNNAVSGSGGGINTSGPLTVTNSTISGNNASFGGGVNAVSSNTAPVIITNSTISNNHAAGDGGGLAFQDVSATLTNCTIADNEAVVLPGSSIRANGTLGPGSSPISLRNTLVTTFRAPSFYRSGSATFISQGNNLDNDGQSGFTNGVNGDIVGTIANPINARLVPLAANGGSTQTHALRCDSPAIDAGSVTGAPVTDQRGLPRNADGNGDNTNAVDIGAFETQKLIVTNTNDSGAGSLRQAILDNNAAGGSLIAFNIAGAGVKTITPLSALPATTKSVDINGYTQPGSSPNALATGNNAVLLIELNGTSAGANVSGLTCNADSSCIRGLAINRFNSHGVHLLTGNDNLVAGNFIGTNVAGSAASNNNVAGVQITNSRNNIIGGNTPAVRNLLSGNFYGIRIGSPSSVNQSGDNVIQGNYIGTNAAGTAALGNTNTGVQIEDAFNNLIGGATAGERNLISGNNDGVLIFAQFGATNPSTGNVVKGNFIGTAANGTSALGNTQDGVSIGGTFGNTTDTIIGGTLPGEQNIIAFNTGRGILFEAANNVRNRAVANLIFSNGSLGIDLIRNGVTANDAGDADTGPNNLQNFPVLSSVTSGGTVSGSLDSTAGNSAYPVRIEFFANTVCDGSGNGEGEVFLGSATLNAPGSFTFNFTPVAGKPFITATATDNNGNTSEFSACRQVCPVIAVNPSTLPGGSVGVTYSQTVTQTGGNGATTFSVSAGALPNGLTLSGAGLISGTPSANGSFNFTVRATDANGCTGERAYTIVIGSCPTITINPATLPNGLAGSNYNQPLTTTGGISPYSFAVTAGALPPGLMLTGGILSGNPTAGGTFNFTVAATDNNGCIGTRAYTLLVCAPITVNPATLPAGALGVAYSQTITQTGAGSPSFSISAGALPGGLSLNATTGALTGTPTATGPFNFTVRATDASGCFGERAYTLTINACGNVTVTPLVLPSAAIGLNYFQQMTATGGVAPYSFALSAGALPGGLSLAANGQLTGAPTAIGNATFTIRATDANNCQGTRQYTLFVNRKFELTASDGAAFDHFGVDATISGDTVIIGAPDDDVGANANQGSAYIYTRSGGAWVFQQKLTAGDGAAGDSFGYAVAIQDDTVIVGAYLADIGAQADAGAAYVFTRSGGIWTQQQKLTAADGADDHHFGVSVALNSDTILIGAQLANFGSGAAYVFVRGGGTWTQQQKLSASDGEASDYFGASVAVEGDTAVVGAPLDDIGANTNQGSAYVFMRSGSVWTQQQKLVAGDGALGDSFGNAVAISGNTALIGAHQSNVPGQTQPGAAYAFTRSGSVWTQQQKLIASDGNPADGVGNYVALEGNLAVVGDNRFFARTFVRSGATWTEQQKLMVPSQIRGVGVSNGVIVAGALSTQVGGNAEQGSVCVFDNCPPIPISPSTLPAGGLNTAYNQTLTASGGSAPYSFDVISGALPAGLSLSSAGVLSGTPTVAGTFNFTVRATATGGCTGTQSYALVIGACPLITVNPATLPNTAFGANYNQTLSATGGADPYSFTVTAGALPTGLTLGEFSGVLSGPVNATGTFSFTIRATDQNGCIGERGYTIVVGSCAALTVNSLGDTPDANPGNGVCADAGGQCTLRAAIQENNALGCGTTINFSVTGTINLGSALPVIVTNATIIGPGANQLTVRRDSAASFSVFSNASPNTAISGLTITNGSAFKGGGISSNSGITINNCVITSNQTTAGGEGGGVWAVGSLTMVNTTVHGNTSLRFGGGVHITAGVATLTNCTISGNSAVDGAGIYNTFGSQTELTNCTITANTATNQAGGFYVRSGSLTTINTIFAGNTAPTGPDVSGVVTSLGNNLIGNTAGASGLVASDLQNVNPRLAPLANNGSQMPTHALRCDSPAIDAGASTGVPATDERGLPRNADGNGDNISAVDIGALEVQKLVVLNTNDSGAGSLRQALLDNNAAGGGLIAFNIAGGGVKTIAPLSALPNITKTVDINGYTQPGSGVNTLDEGNNAVLLIELNGAGAGVNAIGLMLNAGYSCIRGLVINRFSQDGLQLNGAGAVGNLVLGNFVGVNPAGLAASANGFDGIGVVNGASGNTFGGTSPSARNVVSGNAFRGISIFGSNCSGNLVQGNYIGVNARGTAALPNNGGGVDIQNAPDNIVGGTVLGAGNLIAGNLQPAMEIYEAAASGNLVQGNRIGLGVNNTPLGNSVAGIVIAVGATNNTVGGTTPGAANIIAFNAGQGVQVSNNAGSGNRVLSNSIFSNLALGLDIGSIGITPNDAGDSDIGANSLQNFPALNAIAAAGTVTGSLDSSATNSVYPIRLEFFANTVCDAGGNGEGEVFLGFATLAAPGNFTFNYTPIAGKSFITATATDANGNTSEFSACRSDVSCPAIAVNPPTLTTGTAGQPYSQSFTATGGSAPYGFALSAGTLPGGLTLTGGGLLSGTPTGFGSFNFTVRATDANNCANERAYTLVVNAACGSITVNPATLPNGFVGTPYSQTFTATGGTAPYNFSVSAGTLPSGLSLIASTGVLSGTPTATGLFTFTIRATDANGCTGTREYNNVQINSNGLQFFPLPQPVRLLETRAGFNGCVTPGVPINAGSTLTLPVPGGCTGIPANARAVTGNITVVPSGGGFLTLFPSTATQPTVANSNFASGEITNNVFTVGLGATGPDAGAFKIFASATTHVIVDVTGYYAPPGTGGLYFHPLATPVRLLETRAGFNGCFAPGTPLIGNGDPNADPNLDLAVQGRSPIPSPCNSIPASAQVLVGNATSVFPGGGGYLTIYPSGGNRPLVASSNYAGNDVINGPFAVKLGADGKFKIYTLLTTHLVVDILGYYSEDAVDANGAGLLFNPLPEPVRLLETRAGGPPLTGCTRTNAPIAGDINAATHTQPARNFCGLPASAQAVVGNASVVDTAGAGFLTLFPGNLTTAPLVATSNYPTPATFGYNRHFFAGLSPADGTFKVLTQFTTHLILDVSGYFAP